MNYEERYNQALERARKLYEQGTITESLGYVFPELRESKDERIRKEIIQSIQDNMCVIHKDKCLAWLEKQKEIETEDFGEFINELSKQFPEVSFAKLSRIAVRIKNWLEKQGEQKPANKVEPKFKVGDNIIKKHNSDINKFGIFTITDIKNGKYIYNDNIICDVSEQNEWEIVEKVDFKIGDWITFYGGEPLKILKVEPEQNGILDYLLLSQNGHDSYYNKKYVDENARLWTIQDAKDGDVLYFSDETIVIFKDLYNATTFHSYCHIEDGEFGISCEALPDWWEGKEFQPATTEQRDLLFQKMKEAGYEWDAEKKELKKIEQTSAWSEEDERMCQETIDWFEKKCFPYALENENPAREVIKWLKSLKPNHWKPSEYDISLLEEIARNIRNNVRPFCSEVSALEDLIKNLKNL